MTILQNILLTGSEHCRENALYFRERNGACLDEAGEVLFLPPGAEASFDTYFNQFSVTHWIAFSRVEDIALELELHGSVQVAILLHDGELSRELASKTVHGSPGVLTEIQLPPLHELQSGLISLQLTADSALEFHAGRFITRTPPTDSVRLGISITAFRRDTEVKRATRHLARDLEELGCDALLTVVDNGDTLQASDLPQSCTLLKNRNLGGSGGFARGLWHYAFEQAGVTHCLFMDDDASCETESITRTIALLSYRRDANLAVAGAMLFASEPWLQHENGARFDLRCIPLKNNLDLRLPGNLWENDRLEDVQYGAWWFFAFPLRCVERYPFPFFVRGDDVLFSLTNNFRIATLNGICSWQESFSWKKSPMTMYLDMRSHILHYVISGRLGSPLIRIPLMFWRFLLKHNVSCHYASAEAICIAFEDALKPASFWVDNIDMGAKRAELGPLVAQERLENLEGETPALSQPRPDGILSRLAKLASLNGHLLPGILFRESVTLDKTRTMTWNAVFGVRNILVVHPEDATAYRLKHNKRYFFGNLLRGIGLTVRFLFAAPKQAGRRKELEKFMSAGFWETQFPAATRGARPE